MTDKKEPPIEAEVVAQPQALAVRQEKAVMNPLDLEPATFRAGLDRRKENRKSLIDWIREALVEHVDYGRIHAVGKNRCPMAAQGRANECKIESHWSKPSLFKPGAEKICGMLGVTPTFPMLHDYELAALEGREIKAIILRCEILNSAGEVIAHGIGARSVEQDYGDLNKALKMCEKSAHIDGTLRLAGLSEIFTQDIEDMAKTAQEAPKAPAPPSGRPPPPKAAPAGPPGEETGLYRAVPEQVHHEPGAERGH